MSAHRNMHKIYIRRIFKSFKEPLSEYISSEFDLNINNRKRIKMRFAIVEALFKYFKSFKFLTKEYNPLDFPDENAIVLFLHKQPEASTNPLGGYFQDQLFILDLLLAALPRGMNIC